MSKLAIGTRLYNQSFNQKRHNHCIETLIKLKQKFKNEVELYNLTFKHEKNEIDEFIHLPLLQESSLTLIQNSTKLLHSSKECFNILGNQPCEYFAYVNNDILISEKAIRLMLKQEYETYSFSRYDIHELNNIDDPILPIRIEIAGFDLWCCNTIWWASKNHLFKNYVVGQWQWDVDYALTMFNYSNGMLCNDEFYIGHEDHSREWNETSPEAMYNNSLWQTTPYQKRWGEYVYSHLIHRTPKGRFFTPLAGEEELKRKLLKNI